MVFTIKVGFIDSEGVDEMLDLVAYLAAEIGEVDGKRRARGCIHTLPDTTFDVVALRLGKNHACPPIQKLRKPAKLILRHLRWIGHRSDEPIRPLAALTANVRNGSSGKRAAQRARIGKLARSPVSAKTSMAAEQTLELVSRSMSSPRMRLASPAGRARAISHASKRTSGSLSCRSCERCSAAAAGIARKASSACVRRAASSDRKKGRAAEALSGVAIFASAVNMASRTRGTRSTESA